MNGNFYAPSILSHYWSEIQLLFWNISYLSLIQSKCQFLITYYSSLYPSLSLIIYLLILRNFPYPWSPPITIPIFNNLLFELSFSVVCPILFINDLVKSWFIGICPEMYVFIIQNERIGFRWDMILTEFSYTIFRNNKALTKTII